MSAPAEARALTLHQPWASLVALGVKTIETRSWKAPNAMIGRRLLIHAGKRPVRGEWFQWGGPPEGHPYDLVVMSRYVEITESSDGGNFYYRWVGPLGAVVASCVLADCVPMTEWGEDPQCAHLCIGQDGRLRLWDFVEGSMPWAWRAYDPSTRVTSGGPNVDDRTDQRPFGDFAPGRWAWILGDVQPTTERCPRCWYEAPRVTRYVDVGDGGDPVAVVDKAGRIPAAITGYAECETCRDLGRCAPVPMRGRQRLFRPEWPT